MTLNVSTKELSIILGVTDRWIRELLRIGIIQHVDDSGKSLFDAEQCAEAFKRFIAEPVDRRAEGVDERLARSRQYHAELILQQGNRLESELQKIWVKPSAEELKGAE